MRPHVGAHIRRESKFKCREIALGVGCSSYFKLRLAAVVDGREVLEAVLDPAHRLAQAHRQPGDQEILGIELAANPEAAADIRLNQPDIALRQLQHC